MERPVVETFVWTDQSEVVPGHFQINGERDRGVYETTVELVFILFFFPSPPFDFRILNRIPLRKHHGIRPCNFQIRVRDDRSLSIPMSLHNTLSFFDVKETYTSTNFRRGFLYFDEERFVFNPSYRRGFNKMKIISYYFYTVYLHIYI